MFLRYQITKTFNSWSFVLIQTPNLLHLKEQSKCCSANVHWWDCSCATPSCSNGFIFLTVSFGVFFLYSKKDLKWIFPPKIRNTPINMLSPYCWLNFVCCMRCGKVLPSDILWVLKKNCFQDQITPLGHLLAWYLLYGPHSLRLRSQCARTKSPHLKKFGAYFEMSSEQSVDTCKSWKVYHSTVF